MCPQNNRPQQRPEVSDDEAEVDPNDVIHMVAANAVNRAYQPPPGHFVLTPDNAAEYVSLEGVDLVYRPPADVAGTNNDVMINDDTLSGCYLCRKVIGDADTLQLHYKAVHGLASMRLRTNFPQVIRPWIPKDPHTGKSKCFICRSQFKAMHQITNHLENKHGVFMGRRDSKVRCRLCGRTHKLLKHAFTHAKMKHEGVVDMSLASIPSMGIWRIVQ